jgi:hypothetical protein
MGGKRCAKLQRDRSRTGTQSQCSVRPRSSSTRRSSAPLNSSVCSRLAPSCEPFPGHFRQARCDSTKCACVLTMRQRYPLPCAISDANQRPAPGVFVCHLIVSPSETKSTECYRPSARQPTDAESALGQSEKWPGGRRSSVKGPEADRRLPSQFVGLVPDSDDPGGVPIANSLSSEW